MAIVNAVDSNALLKLMIMEITLNQGVQTHQKKIHIFVKYIKIMFCKIPVNYQVNTTNRY